MFAGAAVQATKYNGINSSGEGTRHELFLREAGMIELTEDQQQALAANREGPAAVLNPRTRETYVLVPSSVYARIQHLLQDDTSLSKREVALLIERAMREYDANDPTLELYQHD
jgi:hypothetical protein